MVGTVNFDNRSFRLNFEITAALAGPEFNAELEAMLLEDLANSVDAGPDYFSEPSLWESLKARGSALMAPLL